MSLNITQGKPGNKNTSISVNTKKGNTKTTIQQKFIMRRVFFFTVVPCILRAGQLSRYSDWLRAGRSGDRIPVEARFSAPVQTGPVPTLPPVQWVPSLSRGKERPGRDADPSPPSSAVVMKGQSYTSTRPMGRTACTEPRCLYKGALYFYLYRAS